LQKVDSHDAQKSSNTPTRFLLKERNLGPWMRSFTLPVNTDMKALRARLDAGLLRICVPKKAVVAEPGITVIIE